MKKTGILLTLGIGVALGVSAAPITPDEALSRLKGEGPARLKLKSEKTFHLEHTITGEDGRNAAYVFTHPGEKGFTILSANDLAVPVLGYSETETFASDNIPPAFEWWLKEYERRIEFLESRGETGTPKAMTRTEADKESIEPMLKTKWDQSAPFNQFCPVVSGRRAPTGCVATSMAQVLKYFNWPERGKGRLEYENAGAVLDLNLNLTTFEWDLMRDTYTGGSYSNDEGKAVALLMQACGYSVEMSYGPSSSGAQSYKIANALVNNFRYAGTVSYEDRNLYSPTQWEEMIYANLQNYGPVIYNGTSIEGGHSFVCDGYDKDGYFHFNWGWGGISDGYYTLNVLNPEAQGTGGSLGGYNYGQNAILGMKKAIEDEPVDTPLGNLTLWGTSVCEISDKYITFALKGNEPAGWANTMWQPVKVKLLVEFQPTGKGESILQNAEFYSTRLGGSVGEEISLEPYYYVSYPAYGIRTEIPDKLADGTYKVTLMTRDLNREDAPAQPMKVTYGYTNYCMLTKSGKDVEVTTVSPAQLDFVEASFNSTLYQDRNVRLSVKVKNNSDLDLSCCVQPFLVREGTRQYMGDNLLVSVKADSESSEEWILKFYVLQSADNFGSGKEYTLEFVDRTTGESLGTFGEVKMEKLDEKLKVEVNDFKVEGANPETVRIDNYVFDDVYMVKGSKEMVIDFDYTVTQGLFDSELVMNLIWFNPETMESELYKDMIYHSYPILSSGQGESLTVDLDMSDAPSAGVYGVTAYTISGNTRLELGQMLFAFDQSGISGVIADDTKAEYYNLQGVRISNPKKGDVLIRKKGTKAEKVVF